MTLLGGGFYEGSTVASAKATHAKVALIHRQHQVARQLRDYYGQSISLILRGDEGNDNDQFDENQAPESEARRFVNRFIAPELARPDAVDYDAMVGACETWRRLDGSGVPQPHLEWRARFELTLCRIIQNELQTPYCWGSIPIGNLEAEDIHIFAAVIAEAAYWSAHLYLGPYRKTVAEEIDNWFIYRPTRIWLPELRRLQLPIRPMVATEVGPYHNRDNTGITAEQQARLCVDITVALTNEFASVAWPLVSCLPFGYGTVGTMDVWKLDGYEWIMAAANPEPATFVLPGQVPGGDDMDNAELLRYAADIFGRYGVPWNPTGAICKFWLAELKANRFLGFPMEREHLTENHEWMIQGFSSAIVKADVATWKVSRGLPL
jgi:hypothetical protein